ncbi:unnamed protein product [Zymoseptoria tritici ST99CH_1A5]|uniref:PNPLA domain-containing protein n=4 Tax=Zymoseptoria tritici TaxID=1047171 RepID=F9XEG6_ZYMTI|nr:uncharacterized protein MYCGRDRAFT_110012 [Zymoseptoria tritici IPO323]SMQ52050.1 unnamed protein product [Zymoseptoria tritici ST99CH_3D7]SMR54687.1 unnamed protein product [Zymoseptoria tritici ST99CH_1E4]SMR56501.1 unnamed protein product [Zymoseptoria tritici ST99CH_3D1]SMY25695.1 unnamed protein product [Zymoseptoria tritici ST99CH_1A5]EGP86620.1 hypothetical protein MYCGRDRAFT_110012 [Zymoseptoria tritici IPO323]
MDEAGRIRRKDTTKGPPLRILCLDGGGVRGFSMLIILQELMHKIFVEIHGRPPKRDEIPKPCDHFDLIAGTGTGGLIAIMLGRLRLDLDTCKEVYVRMTKRVFETDKTLFGMPLKSTMFKASRLEDAIRQCVREHTISDGEGNDTLANATPMTPTSDSSSPSTRQRTISQGSDYSRMGMSPPGGGVSFAAGRSGNPNTLLYDTRENRTKTAVTAVLAGSSVIGLLRSYDSRKEPAPDVNCTIWQAGRATCATQLAFKPIQIGLSVYLDEGAGKYNPSPRILDEAVQNEWPGREVGVFVSVGTGKRPPNTNKKDHEWWEGVLGGSMSDFAEARRKLIAKMEGCEDSHQFMLREHLNARGVNPENYYRLNCELGVGEMAMNEWYRLSEISTNTRAYLSKADVQIKTVDAAAKVGKIHFTKVRSERAEARKRAGHDGPEYGRSDGQPDHSRDHRWPPMPLESPANNLAVELPGDDHFRPGMYSPTDPNYVHRSGLADHKHSLSGASYDQDWRYQPRHGSNGGYSSQQYPPHRPSQDLPHSRYSTNSYLDNSPRQSQDFPHAQQNYQPPSPPPVPPKTPVTGGLPYPGYGAPAPLQPRTFMNMGALGSHLPYPDIDGPPPPVNLGSKPQIS